MRQKVYNIDFVKNSNLEKNLFKQIGVFKHLSRSTALLPSNSTVHDFKFKQIDCIDGNFGDSLRGSCDYIFTTMIQE